VSARPNATLVLAATEQVLPSVQTVTYPGGRLAAKAAALQTSITPVSAS